MKEQMLLIDSFPLILEDLSGFLERLTHYYKWGNKETTPEKFLRKWEEHSLESKFYFLGWFSRALDEYGFLASMSYMVLREKQAITYHIRQILEEATPEQKESFQKGSAELKRKR